MNLIEKPGFTLAAALALGLMACAPEHQDVAEPLVQADLRLTGQGDAGAVDAGSFAEGAELVIAPVEVPVDLTPAPKCRLGRTEGCLWAPPLGSQVSEVVFADDVSYVDVLGRMRVVPIAVYRAAGAPQPAPLVLMSHGGADGLSDVTLALPEWASIVAAAGYVVISIAHPGYSRDPNAAGSSDYDDLCAAVGVPVAVGAPCALKTNWARPLDVAAVLTWVTNRVATNPEWAAAIDLGRIGHMGHSAGAGAAMMVGGVTRNFLCGQPFGKKQGAIVPCSTADLVSRRAPEVRAIVAFSPQGPGSDGFMSESFARLAVPTLMATGLNDGDPGEPASREAVFPLLPEGPRWKVYLNDPGAKHGLFGGDLGPCLAQATAERCAELRAALTSAALAFFDVHLRGGVDGKVWLGSGDLAAVTAGRCTITRR
ncbi:MAG: hypothetical protein JNK82_14140 [Myxococcaceae bacterium]|nr:hypothetical protein [Myxococcaceae bacterium]